MSRHLEQYHLLYTPGYLYSPLILGYTIPEESADSGVWIYRNTRGSLKGEGECRYGVEVQGCGQIHYTTIHTTSYTPIPYTLVPYSPSLEYYHLVEGVSPVGWGRNTRGR